MKRFVWLVLFAAGCGPAVESFDLAPVRDSARTTNLSSAGVVRICSGESVQAHWKTKGETAMLVSMGATRAANRTGAGGDPLAPDTLSMTIVASGGGDEAVSTKLVLQYPDSTHDSVGFPTNAVQGDTVVASGTKASSSGGRFTLTRLVNPYDRALQVRHDGRSATLPPQGETDAMAGAPLDGAWEIRTVMTATERSTPRERPARLLLDAILDCTPGAA